LEQLLATKFHIPDVRPEQVQRPRLLQKLSAGLNRRVTLISAPAGFGKTTLLSFIQRLSRLLANPAINMHAKYRPIARSWLVVKLASFS
jgi:ATP/maltotriose-dependent transcriptional regulator MalT